MKKIIFSVLILEIVVIGFLFLPKDKKNQNEGSLIQQASLELGCSEENISITDLSEGFLALGCNNQMVYAMCNCCDSSWFEQCLPAEHEKWTKLYNPETRGCIENCMKARHSVGLEEQVIEVQIVCKSFDQEYLEN